MMKMNTRLPSPWPNESIVHARTLSLMLFIAESLGFYREKVITIQ
jgi:hypothetical protein